MDLKKFALCFAVACTALACGPRSQVRPDTTVNDGAKSGITDLEERVVKLQVQSFTFLWDEIKDAPHQGTGFLISPTLMISNAHVLKRALAVNAETDSGTKLTVKRLLAVDDEWDIAIAEIEGSNVTQSITLIMEPEDPKSQYRGSEVRAAGYTGGDQIGEISFYDGKVNTIADIRGLGQRIIHDTNISSGSSGGPLIHSETNTLLGINHAIQPELRQSFAVPVWQLNAILERAHHSKGRNLAKVDTAGLSLKLVTEGELCLAPHSFGQIPVVAEEGYDLLFEIKPPNGESVVTFLETDGDVVVRELIDTPQRRAISIPKGGSINIYLGNPNDDDTVCTEVGVHLVDWSLSEDKN